MYRLGLQVRVFLPFFYVFAAVVAISGFVSFSAEGDTVGVVIWSLWSVGVTVQAWWTTFRMPRCIETDDLEIRFVSRARTVSVPWGRLRSVASPWYDLNRQVIRWEWDGGRLRTMGSWERQHRLLTTVEQRAPGAVIEGL